MGCYRSAGMARRGSLLGFVTSLIIGLAIGVGGFTFVYARGASYLGNDPTACANCHIMHAHFDAWTKGSHRAVATCNDCHAPHALVRKYWVKAENGFWHSFAFTTGWFHEPIRIRDKNRAVTEQACRDCHGAITEAIDALPQHASGALACTGCHAAVGHLE